MHFKEPTVLNITLLQMSVDVLEGFVVVAIIAEKVKNKNTCQEKYYYASKNGIILLADSFFFI